jgi:hypothetical protein
MKQLAILNNTIVILNNTVVILSESEGSLVISEPWRVPFVPPPLKQTKHTKLFTNVPSPKPTGQK